MPSSVQNEIEGALHAIVIWANDHQVACNGVADSLIVPTFTAPEIDVHLIPIRTSVWPLIRLLAQWTLIWQPNVLPKNGTNAFKA